MTHEETIKKLDERIAALEKLGRACSDPENQRLDNLLRKFAKSVELTAWLGGLCLKVAPIIAAIWFFGEEALHWVQTKAETFLQAPR